MTEQHPITPPSEIAAQWRREAPTYRDGGLGRELWLIDRAAQWAADQELEACCEWLGAGKRENLSQVVALRMARRPKSPSLKRLALLQLDTLNADLGLEGKGVDLSQIRRALEQLND
jgi:hypothetical protein